MASKSISFRIYLNDQLVDTRSFEQEVIKLGRLGSSHLRLEDESIGRMHAVIEIGVDGRARLIDLGTTTGTMVNGARVEKHCALESGDRIQLGAYRLEATLADASPARATPAARAHAPVAAAAAAPAAQASTYVAAPNPAAVAVDLAKVEDASEEVAEVIATYGRSILDVAHVGQSRSRKSLSLPLMAFGGVMMAGGLGLFGYEVSQPWEQYNADVAEATQHHRELPAAPGLGTGSLGMLLALMGLVPFLAGALRRQDVGLEAYTIGESSEANFRVSGAALPDPGATPLVTRTAGGYALAFAPGMSGSVELGGQQLSLDDLVSSGRAQASAGAFHYPLPSGAKAKVSHGDISFSVNLVKRGAVVAGRGEVDWPFWTYFGGTTTIATAFYLLMRSMPDDALAMQLDDDDADARFASYFHQADQEDKAEPVDTEEALTEDSKAQSGETGKRASGAEGKMGDKKTTKTNGAYAMKGPANSVPQLARQFDPTVSARDAGILGILAQQDKHFLASVDGGAFAVGQDDADIWGNIVGVEHAAAYGTGGMGLVGSGKGGGGVAGGLIGMGDTGLIGHGNGKGGLYNGRDGGQGGVTGFGDRKQKVPQPRIGKGVVNGNIDKDMIRRIVRAHLNEVRSCYNAGLTRNPNLEGRVTVQFSIVGAGKVASSVVQENTTKDSAVANCIAKAVKRWKFPKVGNGGTALVSYPFMLQAG